VKVVCLGRVAGGDGAGLPGGVVRLVAVAAATDPARESQVVLCVGAKGAAEVMAHFDIIGAVGRRGPVDARGQAAPTVVVNGEQGGTVGVVQLQHGVAAAAQVEGIDDVAAPGRGREPGPVRVARVVEVVVELGAANRAGGSSSVVVLVGVWPAGAASTSHAHVVIGVRAGSGGRVVAHFDKVGAAGRRGPGDA